MLTKANHNILIANPTLLTTAQKTAILTDLASVGTDKERKTKAKTKLRARVNAIPVSDPPAPS